MGRLRALLLLPFLICASLPAHAQQTPLQVNTPIDRTIGPGQTHEFTVALEENIFIQFVVEQQGIDLYVKVSHRRARRLETLIRQMATMVPSLFPLSPRPQVAIASW